MPRCRSTRRRSWAIAGATMLLFTPAVIADSFTATWLDPVSGDWTDPTKWSTDPAYPNNATNTFYTAIVDRVGAPYTITVDSSVTVSTIFLDSPDARLLLADGTFASASIGGTLNFSRGQVDVAGATVVTPHARLINGSRTTLQSGSFDAGFTELDDAVFVQTGGVHRADDLYLRNGSRYELSGGTLHGGAHSHIGRGGASSTFTMTGGTFYQGGYYTITGGLGAGSFIIDGPTSRYLRAPAGQDTNLVGIGTQSTGHLRVRNGATAELGLTEVGLSYGAGSLIIESGATATAQRLRVGFGTWEFPPNPGHELRGSGAVIVDGARLDVIGWAQQQPDQPTVEVGTTAFAAALGGGELRLRDAALHVQGALKVNLTGQAHIEDSTCKADALHVAGGAATFASGSLEVGALRVSGGGELRLTPGRDKTVLATAVSIEAGRIDLNDNRLIVEYAPPTPLPLVRQMIASAYASGSWGGEGLTSSAAAAGSDHGLGYAEAADLFTNFPATFGGYEVDETAVLVAYTRYGDANLDQVVKLVDFNRLALNFGTTDADWTMADFNYDGRVNLRDFNLLAANFGLAASGDAVTAQDWSLLAAVVPEPSIPVVIALSGALTLARRRHP